MTDEDEIEKARLEALYAEDRDDVIEEALESDDLGDDDEEE